MYLTCKGGRRCLRVRDFLGAEHEILEALDRRLRLAKAIHREIELLAIMHRKQQVADGFRRIVVRGILGSHRAFSEKARENRGELALVNDMPVSPLWEGLSGGGRNRGGGERGRRDVEPVAQATGH